MLDVSSVLPDRDREGVGEWAIVHGSEGIGARVIFSRWKLIYVPVLRGSNRFQARSYARGAVRSEPCQLINCCFVRGIIAA